MRTVGVSVAPAPAIGLADQTMVPEVVEPIPAVEDELAEGLLLPPHAARLSAPAAAAAMKMMVFRDRVRARPDAVLRAMVCYSLSALTAAAAAWSPLPC